METCGSSLVYTCSFQNPVLVHLMSVHAPEIPVLLLDTGFLHPETLEYVTTLRERLGFHLEVVRPVGVDASDQLWRSDADKCCNLRKVEPLNRLLQGKQGWVTGIRRVDSSTRRVAAPIEFDHERGVIKVNPIVAWTDTDMNSYVEQFSLPQHPLRDQGYASIGCWPCTRPIQPGEDRRAGRWAGTEKTECGLHISPVRVKSSVARPS